MAMWDTQCDEFHMRLLEPRKWEHLMKLVSDDALQRTVHVHLHVHRLEGGSSKGEMIET